MKILNVSTLIPLKNLKKENDIILRIQSYLEKNYDYKFKVAKSLPYVNNALSKLSEKWSNYYYYQSKKKVNVHGFETLIYGWIAPPTSNFWLNYFFIPFNWLLYKLRYKTDFDNLARGVKLVIAQNTIPDSVIAYWISKRHGIPYIIFEREQGRYSNIQKKLPFINIVYKSCDQFFTPNPTISKNEFYGKKIELLPHPVDPHFFLEEYKKISLDNPKIITAARLFDWKQIDLVISTLGELKKLGYRFEYTLIGEGPEYLNLKDLAKKERLDDCVRFKKFVSSTELAIEFKSSDIFLLTSYPETLGRVYLESAASGCLIIGHKNTGVDGLFKHKESAIFVNRNTILDNLLMLFSKNSTIQAQEIAQRGNSIVKDLSWENIGDKYHEIFSKYK